MVLLPQNVPPTIVTEMGLKDARLKPHSMATPTLVKKLHFEPLILELHCKRVAFHRRLITILLRWSSGDIL